jgi:hypothetical protein
MKQLSQPHSAVTSDPPRPVTGRFYLARCNEQREITDIVTAAVYESAAAAEKECPDGWKPIPVDEAKAWEREHAVGGSAHGGLCG